MTEADIHAYTGLSGDFNPLYADAEHARSGPYGGLVSPAGLISSVTLGLGAMDVPLPHTVGLVGWTWRFLVPVKPGDSIRSHWRLNRKRDVEDRRWGLAAWQVAVENQRGETVAEAEVVRLVERRERPADGEGAAEGGRSGRRRRRKRGRGDKAPAEGEPPRPVEAEPPPPEAPPGGWVPPAPVADATAPAAEGEAPPPRPRRRRRTKPAEPQPVPGDAAGPPPEVEAAPTDQPPRRRSRRGKKAPEPAAPVEGEPALI